jgi:hypothetical protein
MRAFSPAQTYGWYKYQYRDDIDLPWSRNVADQWTAFARWHDPYVRKSYLKARGFGAGPDARWEQVLGSNDSPQLLSIRPSQYMETLAQQKAHCDAFGRGLNYILDQRAAAADSPAERPRVHRAEIA